MKRIYPFTTISVTYSTRDKLKDILEDLNDKYERNIKYDDVISYLLTFIDKNDIKIGDE